MKAVVFVANCLPDRPRLPVEVRQAEDARHAALVAAKGRWAAPAVRGERNREIRRMFRQGATVNELGQRFGLSRRTVYDVLEDAA